MTEIDTPYDPGVVAVVTASVARYHEFTDSVASLQVPRGTRWSRASSCNIVANRNRVMETLPAEAQWVWWLDDDHAFDPDTLIRLLARQVDVVAPLVAARSHGFVPVAHHPVTLDPYTWQELQDAGEKSDGLVRISATGTPGTLMKRPVWEAVGQQFGPPLYRVDGGYVDKETIAEDIQFLFYATSLGFKCYVDTYVYMDHLNTIALRPGRTKEGKLAIYGMIGDTQIGLIRTV